MEKISRQHKQPTTHHMQTKLMILSYLFFTNRYSVNYRIRNMNAKICVRKRDIGGITLLNAKHVVNIDNTVPYGTYLASFRQGYGTVPYRTGLLAFAVLQVCTNTPVHEESPKTHAIMHDLPFLTYNISQKLLNTTYFTYMAY